MAQGGNGEQWFVCDKPEHRTDTVVTYPLKDWHKRLDVMFKAREAHQRLTGEQIDIDWRTLDVPGTAPVPGITREV